MLNTILKRVVGAAVVAAGATAATAGARYVNSKRINAGEKLGKALLDTQRLEEAGSYSASESEAALAACAAYLINVAYNAASGISGPPAMDAVGYERKVSSERSSAVASIITTAHEPDTRWQFDVEIPGVGRISGSRRLTSAKFSGARMHMRTPDTMSIRFENGYVANIESDLEFSGGLLPFAGPRTMISGSASLSDNRGNVGRLRIESSGEVSGTITRGTDIVGRFDGSLEEGVTFRQYLSGTQTS